MSCARAIDTKVSAGERSGLGAAGCAVARFLHLRGLNFEIDAGNLRAAIPLISQRALAEVGKPQMAVLAQLDPSRNQHTVDIHGGLALELEEDVQRAGIRDLTAQYPAAAAQDRACQGLPQARGSLAGDGLHPGCPKSVHSLCGVPIARWIQYRIPGAAKSIPICTKAARGVCSIPASIGGHEGI